MCIVERQVKFLENGEMAMKPMILRDVAETVGMLQPINRNGRNRRILHGYPGAN